MAVFTSCATPGAEEEAGRTSCSARPWSVATHAGRRGGAGRRRRLAAGRASAVTLAFVAEAPASGGGVAALRRLRRRLRASCSPRVAACARPGVDATGAGGRRLGAGVSSPSRSGCAPPATCGDRLVVAVADRLVPAGRVPTTPNRWWPLALLAAAPRRCPAGRGGARARRPATSAPAWCRPGPGAPRPPGAVRRRRPGLAAAARRAGRLAGRPLAMGAVSGRSARRSRTWSRTTRRWRSTSRASGDGTLVDAFFATSLLLLAARPAGFAVSSALRTRSEETADRLEPLLATAVSRARWLFGTCW